MTKYKNSMTPKEYQDAVARVHSSRKASPIHKSDKDAALEQAYNTAVQTLCDLQGFNGYMLLGSAPFDLEIGIHGKSNADGSNVYKGVEDALNKIAWRDDKQNVHFNAKKLCECED